MLLNALEKDFGEDSVDFLNIFQPRNSGSSRDESDGNSDRVDFWNILETSPKKSGATEAERKEKGLSRYVRKTFLPLPAFRSLPS